MEKNFIGFIIMFAALFTGCKTTGKIDTDQGRDYYYAGELKATAEELDRLVVDSTNRIENIRRTSKDIEDGIDKLIYLFGEYDSEVERILGEVAKERDKIKNSYENKFSGSSTDSTILSSENSNVYIEN